MGFQGAHVAGFKGEWQCASLLCSSNSLLVSFPALSLIRLAQETELRQVYRNPTRTKNESTNVPESETEQPSLPLSFFAGCVSRTQPRGIRGKFFYVFAGTSPHRTEAQKKKKEMTEISPSSISVRKPQLSPANLQIKSQEIGRRGVHEATILTEEAENRQQKIKKQRSGCLVKK